MNNAILFPEGFFWGCSTSSHQVEGGTKNNWSQWEKSPKRLADLKKRGLNHQDYISGLASNSFEMQNADIACLKALGVNSYRFSIEWSRIEPEEGVFNEKAIENYVHFVEKLKINNIEPFVTLWHWTIPLWLNDLGDWESPEIPRYFARFSEYVAIKMKGRVTRWVTLNEPEIYSQHSYLLGEWPPQKKNPFAMLRVLHRLIAGHKLAYDAIKKVDVNNQVGVAKHNISFEARRNNPWSWLLKKVADWWWNNYFLERIRARQDFIGLNFYFHSEINWWFGSKEKYERYSDLNWALAPEHIEWVLKDLKRYGKPVYITENGLADKDDKHRIWYIEHVLRAVHKAMESGVEVKGYSYWSLLDNFEWALGFAPRFGLFEVDRQTFERKARPAAAYYEKICRSGQV